MAEADKLIAAGPTPEPEHMGSARDKENAELVKYWWPNREQTEKACREAETIAFVYLITGEKKYGEAARRWILHLASWNPDGPDEFHAQLRGRQADALPPGPRLRLGVGRADAARPRGREEGDGPPPRGRMGERRGRSAAPGI